MESREEPDFKEYPEIENHYNKDMQKFIDEHQSDELWVATEKIHGTNFCFIHDGNELICAKRNSFLKPTDKFFNFQVIVKKHSDKVAELFKAFKEVQPDAKLIKIYGEFYGGIYPNVKSGNKPIQTTIVYTPELEFEAFDLFYHDINDEVKVFNYKKAVELFDKVKLPYAHIQAEGALKDLMKTLNAEKFESTVFSKHGLPKIDGNLAEGYVLKPAEAVWIDSQRLSIKLKNSKCLESAPAIKPVKEAPIKKEIAVSEEEQTVVDRCMSYISQERFSNIATKLTEDERNEKNINKMMIADSWKDLQKAETDAFVKVANKLKGKIMPEMQKACATLFASN